MLDNLKKQMEWVERTNPASNLGLLIGKDHYQDRCLNSIVYYYHPLPGRRKQVDETSKTEARSKLHASVSDITPE